jgi:hypothetical protein
MRRRRPVLLLALVLVAAVALPHGAAVARSATQPSTPPAAAPGRTPTSTPPAALDAGPAVRTGASASTSATAPSATDRRLTFTFASGWTTADRTAIRAMLDKAYPVLVGLYGAPAFDQSVQIVPDATLQGWALYEWTRSSATCSGKIRINPADARDAMERIHYLTHEMLHAFHGCYALPGDDRGGADALEEGMTEAAAALVRGRIAGLLGVRWDRPAEPAAPYADTSAVTIADQLNTPLVAASAWVNADGVSRPQVNTLYAQASVFFWALHRARADGTFFKSFNAGWYAARRSGGDSTSDTVHRIAAGLVPRLGFLTYAGWRDRQLVMRPSHTAGTRALCADASTQLADPFYLSAPLQVIRTDTAGNDRSYSRAVRIQLVRPNGTTWVSDGSVTPSELPMWVQEKTTSPVAAPLARGAYRLVFKRADGSSIGSCWLVGALRSAGVLAVIAKPGTSVRVTVPVRTTNGIEMRTRTATAGANRLAIFTGVAAGIARVGTSATPDMDVVPTGARGAVVNICANASCT